MIHTPDVIIPPGDGPFSFCGAEFHIVHTPGHSAGHICTVTPDNVCYTADALLSYEMIEAKLPYSLSHRRLLIAGKSCGGWGATTILWPIGGVCGSGEIDTLIEENQKLVRCGPRRYSSWWTGP